MVSPLKDLSESSRSSAGSEDETMLAELRANVNALTKEVADIVEKRTRAACETAEAGAVEVRRAIRRQPVVSMAIATAAGVLIALAFVPRFSRPTARSRWDSFIPSMPTMPVTRADLYDLANNIQSSVARAAHGVPSSVAPTFERLVDAITRTDPTASVGSIIEKASSWFQKAQGKAKEKMS
jgi:ElaB/YqjD/DUF883 family membrane-anchored ribosome-binding protein